MHTRFVRAVVLALALVAVAGGAVTAKRPSYLLCDLPDGTLLHIVVDDFEGMQGAARQCLVFWNGRPSGAAR